jgi:antitoxin component of MazEF toxin-antitoxin module
MTVEKARPRQQGFEPQDRRRYSLQELIEQITPESRHAEIDWGPRFGKEVW